MEDTDYTRDQLAGQIVKDDGLVTERSSDQSFEKPQESHDQQEKIKDDSNKKAVEEGMGPLTKETVQDNGQATPETDIKRKEQPPQKEIPHIFMDQPKPFIYESEDEDGKLIVSEEIWNLLSHCHRTVAVIAVVGKYRTGKSYLMNRCFDSNCGFNLGYTVNSETKGIWIWARPHPEDKEKLLILLDTEGLYDVNKGDRTHDMKLFSLALLLSNCLINNSLGALDDNVIRDLHLVTSLTENIQIKKGKEEDGDDFSKYFPAFFFVLRDFCLKLEIEGAPCTENEYMENALKLQRGRQRRVQEYNAPRECIRQYFHRRFCFTFPKPVEEKEKLWQLDSLPESEISEEFLSKVKTAIEVIMAEATALDVDQNIITGSRFVQLAKVYVTAMNEGTVPCISSAVELLKDNECQNALEEAIKIYTDGIQSQLNEEMPLEHDDLTELQKQTRESAISHYHERAMFDTEHKYLDKLQERLDELTIDQLNQNNQTSKARCDELLKTCYLKIREKMDQSVYLQKGGYDEYKLDKQTALMTFQTSPSKGPMAEMKLAEYLDGKKSEEKIIIDADEALSAKDKQLAEEQKQRELQEAEKKAALLEQKRLADEMARKEADHLEMLEKQAEDFQERQKTILEKHNQDMAEKEKELKRLEEEGATRQAEQMRELMETLKETQIQSERNHERQLETLKQTHKQHTEMLLQRQKDQDESRRDMMNMLEVMQKKEAEQRKETLELFTRMQQEAQRDKAEQRKEARELAAEQRREAREMALERQRELAQQRKDAEDMAERVQKKNMNAMLDLQKEERERIENDEKKKKSWWQFWK